MAANNPGYTVVNAMDRSKTMYMHGGMIHDKMYMGGGKVHGKMYKKGGKAKK
jgi:hypothetical protein